MALGTFTGWKARNDKDAFGGLFEVQGILKGEKKVGASVIQTISLIWYHSMGALDKGFRIIKVALY